MRIHHLNCGTCCPVGGYLFDGTSSGVLGKLVCHCLLIETDDGLILVDTGFGMRDIDHPYQRLPKTFMYVNNIQLRAHETAISQVRAMGFDPRDVRHIIITHLDFDHAGGIEDFPNAVVHVATREKEAAETFKGGKVGKLRFRPQQWNEVHNWALYPFGSGESWFGFDAVRGLAGISDDILLIPLAGHTWGHCGVAIDGPDGWMLHAGDAYFYRGEMEQKYRCPPGLRGYQRLMEVDRSARLRNQGRLRELADATDVQIFCAHDSVEFADLADTEPVTQKQFAAT